MKTNILRSIVMMSAVVLGSCTTTKYTAQQKDFNDDVYYSKAKAGDAVEYVNNDRSYRNDGYYDDYSSRISRFGGYSPFAYDGFYNSYYGAGLGLGLGYGLGSFYGYSPYSLYSPYSYYGTGYGLGYGGLYGGGYGYGGLYSGYGYTSANTARPSRGNGNPNAGLSGAMRGASSSVINSNIGRSYNSSGSSTTTNSGYSQRPTRQYVPQTQQQPTYTPSQSTMGSGFNGGGGGGGRVSGGGRPGRG